MSERFGFLVILTVLWVTGAPADSDGGPTASGSVGKLGIAERYNLPLKEISGLALERSSSRISPDDIGIYAVGDSSFDVVRFARHRFPPAVSNVANTIRAKADLSSQWEAVATDGISNICILAESSSRVVCLSGDLKHDLGRMQLDHSNSDRLGKLWKKEPNSRGEGMILMRRGHVLLLKEKRPPLLVEFGPQGDTADGWDRHALLANGEAFVLPASKKLVALKTWAFAGSLAAIAPDASEITVGPDGRLYMLSQEGAVLIRLERSLAPDKDKVHANAWWQLPEQFDHAEGLAIDHQMHPWVAIDVHDADKHNLFRLTPIDAP